MTDELITPPVLSTPDTRILDGPDAQRIPLQQLHLTDDEIIRVYEVERTSREIADGGWQRVALQFPDGMLHDAPRVFELLQATLETPEALRDEVDKTGLPRAENKLKGKGQRLRLCILADTSYGACCVDEIAAEHVEADVVVHYGRSCLSPTARLPVIYVFTSQPLLLEPVVEAFKLTFPDKNTHIILMQDVTYSDYMPALLETLHNIGYSSVFLPSIIHDPSSPIPNRSVPPEVEKGTRDLKDYQLFHISDPPASLLLTLSSRLHSMYICPATTSSTPPQVTQAQTSQQLRRRYALVTSLTTCPIFGILINTLSVKNYLSTVSTIQAQIAAAGKKSYTFVVGKVNAAKVANFSEIGGWVVVGCWESSLIDSTDFYRPIITPFELGLTLMSDKERIWTGEWDGDFSSSGVRKSLSGSVENAGEKEEEDLKQGKQDGGIDEEESEPPEFDLRTGRYVSHSRPMTIPVAGRASVDGMKGQRSAGTSQAMTKRAVGDLAIINGAPSPGAEYLRSQRTWKGLGSDFEIAYDHDDERAGTPVEQGRSGIARGYTVGVDAEKS